MKNVILIVVQVLLWNQLRAGWNFSNLRACVLMQVTA